MTAPTVAAIKICGNKGEEGVSAEGAITRSCATAEHEAMKLKFSFVGNYMEYGVREL